MHPTCLHGRGRSSQDSLCCGSAFAIMDFSPQSHFWGRYPQVASCSSSRFEAPGRWQLKKKKTHVNAKSNFGRNLPWSELVSDCRRKSSKIENRRSFQIRS